MTKDEQFTVPPPRDVIKMLQGPYSKPTGKISIRFKSNIRFYFTNYAIFLLASFVLGGVMPFLLPTAPSAAVALIGLHIVFRERGVDRTIEDAAQHAFRRVGKHIERTVGRHLDRVE
eukprot:TRINITY_DN44063_c0_g1_i1.p3 TRINITY_DN44063_c0_g1~~TRINITY_DN44063_c0_g1_i1.p3  ORF type:complete len:117 (+),score=3.80 TRINITY_DN44063_c0_g1_i1:188-538(+)